MPVHTVDCYAALKGEGLKPFAATGMDLEMTTLSEVSWAEKDKYRMTSLKCGILRNDTNELTNETDRLTDTDRKQTAGYQRGKGWWERGKLGGWN